MQGRQQKEKRKMKITNDIGQERQHLTAVWRNGGFSASYDSFVLVSSAVLRLNFCAKNPPLRQAANRYGQGYDDTTRQTKSGSF